MIVKTVLGTNAVIMMTKKKPLDIQRLAISPPDNGEQLAS